DVDDARCADGCGVGLPRLRGDQLVRVRRARQDAQGSARFLESRARESPERSGYQCGARQAWLGSGARHTRRAGAVHGAREPEMGQGRPGGEDHDRVRSSSRSERNSSRTRQSIAKTQLRAQTMPSTIIDSDIFGDIFSAEPMRKIWSDENRTQKYLDVEAALARVQGRLGIIPQEAADEIAKHCTIDQIDMRKLKQQTERIGYPILGVVSQLN